MKKIIFGILSVCTLQLAGYSQPVVNNPANINASGANSQQFWSRQGNTLNNGTNNVFGFQAGWNSQVWFTTNGFYRMMMNNGAGGNVDGRIGMGNSLPGTFNPVDRLQLHQIFKK
jgi:hypothetical protein